MAARLMALLVHEPRGGPALLWKAAGAVRLLLLLLRLTSSWGGQVATWKAWHGNQKAECERLRQGRGDLEARMASQQAELAQTQVWHGACSL